MAFQIAVVALVFSVILNALQAYFFATRQQFLLDSVTEAKVQANLDVSEAVKAAKKERPLTISAEDLLHDLTRGPAVIKVEVIDAKNLFLRSPRT